MTLFAHPILAKYPDRMRILVAGHATGNLDGTELSATDMALIACLLLVLSSQKKVRLLVVIEV